MTEPEATAAFVRVEEVLLPPADLQATAFLAASAPGAVGRVARLGALAASLPAIGALGLVDRRLQRRLEVLHWRGLSLDRVELLTREHHARFLAGRTRALGREVVARARAQGHRVVLVTSGLALAAAPLAAEVAADDVVGNALELQDGVATGRILEARGAGWPERYAAAHGLRLAGSLAYGADVEDAPLLAAVGHPCAVNPDRRLRLLAEQARWPILYAR